jgi:hypothetical protein
MEIFGIASQKEIQKSIIAGKLLTLFCHYSEMLRDRVEPAIRSKR